jgi:hypothetical protein
MLGGDFDIVKTHYSVINFGSKSETYWAKEAKEDNFRSHFYQWCTLAGVRNWLPDDTQMGYIELIFRQDYPHLNHNSVYDAIRMNLRGDFGEVVQTFNELNTVFISAILRHYVKMLKKSHALDVKIRDEAKNAENTPSPLEVEKNLHEQVVKDCLLLSEGSEIDFYNLKFDFIEKSGARIFTKEERMEAFANVEAVK